MTAADVTAVVLVDTNVLLAATDTSRVAHAAATAFLEEDERRLAIAPQIVREYLAVATRSVEANGFGLSGEDAVANVVQVVDDMELLSEDAATGRLLLELVDQGLASGKQVHDANLVAVAIVHGATAIVTDNNRHFARFGDLVPIESVGGAPARPASPDDQV